MSIPTLFDHPGCSGYAHDAVLYRSDQELLDVVVPFIIQGARSGEPTLVALGLDATDLIKQAVGDQSGITFVGAEEYQRPASTIHNWFNRFQQLISEGATQIRVVGGIPHTEPGPNWNRWARYEAAINHIFADLPLWTLCAYDARLAPPSVLHDVSRTHPRVITATQPSQHNPHYQDPALFLTARRSVDCHLAPDTTPDIVLLDPTPSTARHTADTAAVEAGLDNTQRQNLAVAVTELTTNAHLHGRPPVWVEVWVRPGAVTVSVADSGTGPDDAFVGLSPVRPGSPRGRGMWIAKQLCDDVSLTTTSDGFTARLAVTAH